MSLLTKIPMILDPYLIFFYRFTGIDIIDYFTGTFTVALITVVVGEFTLSAALRWNRAYIERMEAQLSDEHHLSMAALQARDNASYRAINRQANDTFGKYFFSMIAHSAACLWPIPFALAWMQSRFAGVAFEFAYPVSLIWPSTGYFTTFILCYILARILFRNIRRYLPYFRTVQKTLDFSNRPTAEEDRG